MAKVKTTGVALKDTMVFGAGMLPITEFPERVREGQPQLSAEGRKTYGVPGVQALDVSGDAPRPVQGDVYVNITDVANQEQIVPGKAYAPAGNCVVGVYFINGKELTSVACDRLVPTTAFEQKRG